MLLGGPSAKAKYVKKRNNRALGRHHCKNVVLRARLPSAELTQTQAAQLRNVPFHLWADRYDRDLTDVFAKKA
jgi:TolB-like protein